MPAVTAGEVRRERRAAVREVLAGGEVAGLTLEAVRAVLEEQGHGATLPEVWWHLQAIQEGEGEGDEESAPSMPRPRDRRGTGRHRQTRTAGPRPVPPLEAPPPREISLEAWAFGQALRHLRGRRTQKALAAAAGINPTSWSLYEHGRASPRAKNLRRVLQAVGCTDLEFEETVWQFRRRRLLEEERAGRGEGDPRFARVAPQLPRAVEDRQESTAADPLRRELRALLVPLMAALEEILVRVLTEWRGRGSGSSPAEAEAGFEEPDDLAVAR